MFHTKPQEAYHILGLDAVLSDAFVSTGVLTNLDTRRQSKARQKEGKSLTLSCPRSNLETYDIGENVCCRGYYTKQARCPSACLSIQDGWQNVQGKKEKGSGFLLGGR